MSIVAVPSTAGRVLQNRLRNPSARLMLCKQGVDKGHHLSGFLETRKNSFLFRLLVIIFDEVSYNLGRANDDRRIKVTIGSEFANSVLVDQKHAIEHTVLPHQIFR